MTNLNNMYELPPIDDWSKSLSLKKVFGMFANQIYEDVCLRVLNYCGESPNTIRCGLWGNPQYYNFEPIVYAKINNNGTVFAFTDAILDGCFQVEKVSEHATVNDLPF